MREEEKPQTVFISSNLSKPKKHILKPFFTVLINFEKSPFSYTGNLNLRVDFSP